MVERHLLSIEEVAFAMAAAGNGDIAASFLQAIVGDLPADNLTGRLTAASHSLLARGLLTIDLDQGRNDLDPNLGTMIATLVGADYSLRCAKLSGPDELTVTYFVRNGNRLEYQLETGVVSCLTLIESDAVVANRVSQFANCSGNAGEERVFGRISGDSLQILRRLVGTGQINQLKQGIENALGSDGADDLVAAMTDPQAEWGTILLLTTDSASTQIEANRGVFFLNAAGSTWLFDASENATIMSVVLGSAAMVESLVHRLLNQASAQIK